MLLLLLLPLLGVCPFLCFCAAISSDAEARQGGGIVSASENCLLLLHGVLSADFEVVNNSSGDCAENSNDPTGRTGVNIRARAGAGAGIGVTGAAFNILFALVDITAADTAADTASGSATDARDGYKEE